jgi:chaperonin GroES
MNYEEVKPLQNHVLVKRSEKETLSEGGLVVVSDKDESPYITGLVLAVGPGKKDSNGNYITPDIQVADYIIVSKNNGVNFDDTIFLFREEDIIGLV